MNAKWETAGRGEGHSNNMTRSYVCGLTGRKEGGQSVRRRQAVTDRSADRSGLRDAHVGRDKGKSGLAAGGKAR